MNDNINASAVSQPNSGGWKKKVLVITGIVLACCIITAGVTAWWVKYNFYASPLKPVQLSQPEAVVLDGKLKALEGQSAAVELPDVPVKTSEELADEQRRTILLTEREINAFLARQGIGEQFKIQLGNGGMSATMVAPIADDVPLLGGTSIRLRVALGAKMSSDHQCNVQVTDVSVGGVPLPNAWLGDIKGVNLLASNLEADPLVKRFLAGIKEFEIRDGSVRILLDR